MDKTYIIVPTYGQEDSTIRCFESIKKYTQNYIIIWVDNGSGSDSVDRVKKCLSLNKIPHIAIENEENLGFVKGTNQGIQEVLNSSDCKYVAFVNNDIEVYQNWLNTLIDVMNRDKRNGIIGPISSEGTGLQAVNNLAKQHPDIFSDIPKYEHNPAEYSKIISDKYKNVQKEMFVNVAFFCTLLKKELIEDIGILDEAYGIGYFDDNDFCERALINGWKVILSAEVFVFHNHGKTFKSRFDHQKKIEMFNHNKEVFNKKFKKGKYNIPLEDIDDVGVLRLKIKRLTKSFEICEELRVEEKKYKDLTKENEQIKSSKFWKLRNHYLKIKHVILRK